ncbi:S8 family serine peptidase [Spongiactinospora rosea]|uniref:S8 family serine peptidase n=1 Tax=Spongiactinospora rosea TaxID=2248750 RepID=UPI001314D116|nr:S8 family serine peptidase [Spongiactinospora rosea]
MTGDRVKLYAQGESGPTYEIEPGPGRDKVRFTAQERDGHLSVYPADALPLVGRGLVDKRLFDVTQLVAWGYDDSRSAEVPLIVRSPAVPRLTAKAAKTGWRSEALDLSGVKVTKDGAEQAWKQLTAGASARSLASGVTKLWLDGKRTPYLAESVKQIGAPAAWQRGLTGKGVTVAVIDSGYDERHPDLADSVTAKADFTGTTGGVQDEMHGHGTHQSSIIAGSGKASGGKYRGVAPDAKLAIAKVACSDGYTDSYALRGMDWAAGEAKAKIALLSLGTTFDSQIPDLLEEAVNTLTEVYGTLFVVAAGNYGPGKTTLGSPGSADAALTVGAVSKSDRLADFSSRGPRAGDHAVKPDITAPGVAITAAMIVGTGPENGQYSAESGTSMAAAHVAGAAALLAEAHPDWTAEQLKGALIGTAVPNPENGPYEQGAGRVDVDAATKLNVTATPGNVWTTLPYGEDAPVRKTITYTNSGDRTVFLDLRMESAQPGVALPAGLLKPSAQQIKVPAHGQATVTLDMARADVEPGEYPGVLVASSGQDVVLRTLAGTYVEPESYDVDFRFIDRNGDPAIWSEALVYSLERNWVEYVPLSQGEGSVRLPAGDWTMQGGVHNYISGETYDVISHESIKVDADHREVVVDARDGKAVKFGLDDPDGFQDSSLNTVTTHFGGERFFRSMYNGTIGGLPIGEFYVIPSKVPDLTYQMHNAWSRLGGADAVRYDLVKEHSGGLPDDPVYDFEVKDLAKITMTIRGSGVPAHGAAVAVGPAGMGVQSTRARVPGTLINYRTFVLGQRWDTVMHVGPTHSILSLGNFLRGKTASETWNQAVLGPGLQLGDLVIEGNDLHYSGGRQFADPVTRRTGFEWMSEGEVSLRSGGKLLKHLRCSDLRLGLRCGFVARLPDELASYTLTEVSTRPTTYASLATRVETSWTFDGEKTPVPWAVRRLAARIFPAGLDELNRAKRTVTVPIAIRLDCPECLATVIKRITVEASYDDGKTWQPLQVRGSGLMDHAVMLKPPARGDYVSLRVNATATDGKGLTQTVIRAFGLKD